MIESLLQRTAGIAPRAATRARESRGPDARVGGRSATFLARDTATAIEHGAAIAVAGAVERAVVESRRELEGAAPLVILTGGGAAQLRRLLPIPCIEMPDLVLRGIALHAGLALR